MSDSPSRPHRVASNSSLPSTSPNNSWPWATTIHSSHPSLLRYATASPSGGHRSSSSLPATSSSPLRAPMSTLPPNTGPWANNSTSPSPGLSWQNSSSSVGSSRHNTGTSSATYSASNGGYGMNMQDDRNMKQWSFMGFEWIVRDVRKLRDHLEGRSSSEDEEEATDLAPEQPDEVDVEVAEEAPPAEFDIFKQSPYLGDKFKLEIAPTGSQPNGTPVPSSTPQTLTMFITCMLMDHPHVDYEISATMMAAIKCQDDRVGERGSRPEWAWETWQHDWVFRQDHEVWACALPSLSQLLANPRIRETDAFVISIQIHCPVGPQFPAQPSAYYVPRDLLDGLEASLDNSNTGDVRFVCVEKFNGGNHLSPALSESASPTTHRAPSPASASGSAHSIPHSHISQPPSLANSFTMPSPLSAYTTARKRVIYAHSDILVRRSEYFATMFGSTFSETVSSSTVQPQHDGRKLFTVIVEEADFETIYWLLKFCYANWLLFKERDDPRSAVEGLGAGWSVKWLMNVPASNGEWGWKTFGKPPNSVYGEDSVGLVGRGADSRSVSDTSADSHAERDDSKGTAKGKQPAGNTSRTPIRPQAAQKAGPPVRQPNAGTNTTTTARRSINNNPAINSPSSSMRSPTAVKHMPIPLTISANPPVNYPPSPPRGYPLSPAGRHPRQSSNQNQIISSPDPHLHPTPHPPPASALAMYHVAHRYAMPTLSGLALEHMMNTISPETSFALLLASTAWEELRNLVEDYVVEKWDEVQVTAEFEACCQEVAAGEWGPEGGRTMTALFRRLRSPA